MTEVELAGENWGQVILPSLSVAMVVPPKGSDNLSPRSWALPFI
jgi:hypothetical protein